ncbi:MAG: TRAP-type C4-dicarboxylate transport system substrate-binding protein [Marinomonas primoryensis]|jgi:TRAP-type C4-dicarboxylate transport system substrate-binding protein
MFRGISMIKHSIRSIAKLVTVGCVLFGTAQAQAQAPTVLQYSDHQPLNGMRMHFLNDVFFPAVERESEGRLKIETHWDGELAIAYDALPSLSTGKTDISVIVPEYKSKEMPLHQIFKGFPVGPSGDQQVAFFREVFDTIPEFNQELNDNNIRPIFLSTGFPAGFFGTKSLPNLQQIKQQKWRSASFWHLDFLKSAGAEPVKMHWGPEVYDALSDGRLDGILVNIDSAYNLDLHKTAKHSLISKKLWLGHLYIIAINNDVWEKLEDKDKQAFNRAAEYAYGLLGDAMDKSYAEMVSTIKHEGNSVRELTDAEIQTWANTSDFASHQRSWAKGLPNNTQKTIDVINRVELILNRYND